jgi:hypothetical protein
MAKPKLNLGTNKDFLQVYCTSRDKWITISELRRQHLKIKEDSHGYEVLKFACTCGIIHESVVR